MVLIEKDARHGRRRIPLRAGGRKGARDLTAIAVRGATATRGSMMQCRIGARIRAVQTRVIKGSVQPVNAEGVQLRPRVNAPGSERLETQVNVRVGIRPEPQVNARDSVRDKHRMRIVIGIAIVRLTEVLTGRVPVSVRDAGRPLLRALPHRERPGEATHQLNSVIGVPPKIRSWRMTAGLRSADNFQNPCS